MTEPENVEHFISANIRMEEVGNPPSLSEKIDIFEDRVTGWQLGIARQLYYGDDETGIKPVPHCGFAVLSIIVSYFEMIAKFAEGFDRTGKSKDHFVIGFKMVFPGINGILGKDPAELIQELYTQVRCGLYHAGMTGTLIQITGQNDQAFVYDVPPGIYTINPGKMVERLDQHFVDFIKALRTGSDARLLANFERRFDAEP